MLPEHCWTSRTKNAKSSVIISAKVAIHPGSPSSPPPCTAQSPHLHLILAINNYSSSFDLNAGGRYAFKESLISIGCFFIAIIKTPAVINESSTFFASFFPFSLSANGKNKKFAALMHFAGFVQVEESVSCPDKYFKNNTTIILIQRTCQQLYQKSILCNIGVQQKKYISKQ